MCSYIRTWFCGNNSVIITYPAVCPQAQREWQRPTSHAARHHAVRSNRAASYTPPPPRAPAHHNRFDFDQQHMDSAWPYRRAGRRTASSSLPYATNSDMRHNLSFTHGANRTASSPLPEDTFEDFGYMPSDHTRRIERAAVILPSLWRSADMLFNSAQGSHDSNQSFRTERPPHMSENRYDMYFVV